jgi:hypothetical protein
MKTAGTLLWFNWNTLADQGHRFYAAYIYNVLIPLLSPNSGVSVSCRLFDGDFLSMAQLPPVNASDTGTFEQIKAQGLTNMYVIGIYGEVDVERLDASLRKNGVAYAGMLNYQGIEFDQFYKYTIGLALVLSVAINGKEFKKLSFDFMSDEQLVSLGFNVTG